MKYNRPWLAQNLKTGDIYIVTGERINCTNGRENEILVEYEDKEGNQYLREIGEFKEKFKRIKEDQKPLIYESKVWINEETGKYLKFEREGFGLVEKIAWTNNIYDAFVGNYAFSSNPKNIHVEPIRVKVTHKVEIIDDEQSKK